ncbi:Zinc finger protein ZAT5 [Linum grandiflorum]
MADMVIQSGECNDHGVTTVAKGKRTKRQRPLFLTADSNSIHASTTTTSTTSSMSAESTCTEEEDMANCLILLAQGMTTSLPAMESPESFVYQCKTCDRCFNSFQALGGHRASHKRPRLTEEEKSTVDGGKAVAVAVAVKSVDRKGELDLSLGINVNTKQSKVHECSICGAGFSSGQALGGHMRRHRTVVVAPPMSVGSGLELDLNLPAPEDVDGREVNKFRFVFSSSSSAAASALVDCHF